MIDLHAHFLPGIDDGPSTWDKSLDMARAAVDDGVTAVVVTPHWHEGVHENTRDLIRTLCHDSLHIRHSHNASLPHFQGL